MTSNNLEAIKLLAEAYGRMDIFRYESKLVKKALSLLQADEVQGECRCIKAINHAEICSNCVVATRYPKPTKETKLDRLALFRTMLKLRSEHDQFIMVDDIANLIDILLEEEY